MRHNLEDPKVHRGRNEGPMFWGNSRSILQGTYVVGTQAGVVHFLDPNGSDRDVYLPQIVPGGGQVYVICNVGTANSLAVRDAGGVLITTLSADSDFAMFISSPNEWVFGVMVGTAAPSSSDEDWWVNARDFSPFPASFGQGFTDDGIAIQAAIDYAFANNKRAVRIPSGSYCIIKEPIWLAPPGTYDNVDPETGGQFDDFQFSMALIGDETLGDSQYRGVTIEAYQDDGAGGINWSEPLFDYPAIIVGPGQGMRVAGLTVRGGGGSLFQNTFRPPSIGIAISGGPGGASRTLIERCWVQSARTGFKTGWNQDSLADSNTFIKCAANNCYYGWDYSKSQNYINEMYSCNVSYCVQGVRSLAGKAVNIYGGNYSYPGAITENFAISGTTALSSVSNVTAGTYLGKFTTTITYAGELFGFAENGFTDDLDLPIYTDFAVETEHFGVIPLMYVSYDPSTNNVTLELQEDWVLAQFGFNKDFTLTDLEDEIQACTTLISSTRFIAFRGQGIHVYGVHTENPNTVFTLLDTFSLVNGDRFASIENIYFNYTPSTDVSGIQKRIQLVTPLINCVQAGVSVKGGQWNAFIGNYPYLVNFRGANDFIMESENMWVSPNMWVSQNGRSMDSFGDTYQSTGRGAGQWAVTPFFPLKTGASYVSGTQSHHGWTSKGRGKWKALGYVPYPGVSPEIRGDQYDALIGALVPGDLGVLPVICGQVSYRVTDWDENAADGMFVVSDHEMFSYGQDITTLEWTYKGQSNCLYLDDISWMFPGLKIGLDNGGGIVWYIVTGLYPAVLAGNEPRPGYVTVIESGQYTGIGLLAGDKETIYTDTVIYQEAYGFKVYGGAGTGEAAIEVIMSGGATVLTTGVKVNALEVPFDCTITGVKMFGDPSGSVVVDIWKDTYANYPPTVADSIVSGAPPTISSDVKMTDTTLSGWSKTLNQGDILRFNINSVTNFTSLTIVLEVDKR